MWDFKFLSLSFPFSFGFNTLSLTQYSNFFYSPSIVIRKYGKYWICSIVLLHELFFFKKRRLFVVFVMNDFTTIKSVKLIWIFSLSIYELVCVCLSLCNVCMRMFSVTTTTTRHDTTRHDKLKVSKLKIIKFEYSFFSSPVIHFNIIHLNLNNKCFCVFFCICFLLEETMSLDCAKFLVIFFGCGQLFKFFFLLIFTSRFAIPCLQILFFFLSFSIFINYFSFAFKNWVKLTMYIVC